MRKQTNDKSQVEKYLTQLPTIKDKRSKSGIYHRMEHQLQQKNKSSLWKKKRWIPIVAVLSPIVILFIIVQTVNLQQLDSNSSGEVTSEAYDSGEGIEIEESIDLFESNEIRENLIEDDEVADLREVTDFNYLLMDMTELDTTSIVTIPFVTHQQQTVIPIHILARADEQTITQLLDRLNKDMKFDEYGVNPSPLQGISIPLTNNDTKVNIHLTEDSKSMYTSTNLYLFEQALHYFYQHSNVEYVQIEGNQFVKDQYNHGTLPIRQITNHPVKVYRSGLNSLLVPVLHESFTTINEALEEMKEDEESFHIYHTIPKQATIDTNEISNQHVKIELFTEDITNNQQTVWMIESIIATAALFGYDLVTLDIGIDFVGKYDLTKPIHTKKVLNYIPLANE
ncbi:hypothetical protein GGQ92_000447 [Gracilibacillus halotolerans]|uniref:Uncharacterized protein n=1 Tax=Gracilibacillus halotolerans TaxID=74386 RepID=A0A841RCK6_9BACI|nr:hypothetical protein [Gracilibacillus halotolerans]MBB6511680.1 hypothetical protein [Gracilibacillus halotolerans]